MKFNKKLMVLTLIISLIVVLVLGGCKTTTEETAEVEETAVVEETVEAEDEATDSVVAESAQERFKIIWSGGFIEHEWFQKHHKVGIEAGMRDFPVDVTIAGPSGYDLDEMFKATETSIAAVNPDGMLVIGSSAMINPLIEGLVDQGKPVIVLEGPLPNSKSRSFIGTGNFAACEYAGGILAEELGGEGEVIFVYVPGQENLELNVAGYKSAFEAYPDIKVVDMIDNEGSMEVAITKIKAAILAYPNLKAIIGVDGLGGSAAATAVREAEKQGEIMIYSMDAFSDVLPLIESGEITASIAQNQANMSYWGIAIISTYLQNKDSFSAEGGVKLPILVDSGVSLVTKDNVAEFMEWSK